LSASKEETAGAPEHLMPGPSPFSESLIRDFVAHWGLMARTWGINSSMGELFALLYITGTDWTADELRTRLAVSRGNVSMNLRELLAWGVVHKVHRHGERRELFRAELDPSLHVLDRTVRLAEARPELADLQARVESLRQFFGLIDSLAVRLLSMPSADLAPDDFPTPDDSG
jgi:HTH-type transcriptional regulator, glycine betaine synthesis regulator